MKKYSIFAFTLATALILTLASCTKGKTINVTLSSVGEPDTEWYVVSFNTVNFEQKIDTIEVTGNKFSYEIDNDSLHEVWFYPKSSIKLVDGEPDYDFNKSIDVFVNKSSEINIDAKVLDNYIDYTVEGQEFSKQYALLQDTIRSKFALRLKEATSKMTDEENSNEVMEELNAIYGEIQTIFEDYTKKNPDTELSAYMKIANSAPEDFEKVEKELSDKVKNGILKTLIDGRKKMVEDLKALNANHSAIKEGAEAPNFTLKDINGKSVSLSDFKGKKAVVLDFWGTWCHWCMKGVPDMKVAYESCKNNIEFVGIDCGDSPEDWKSTVAEKGMNWTQLINEEANDVSQLYGIQGYPTKIIINKEGIIVSVFEGEDPAFYESLKKLEK